MKTAFEVIGTMDDWMEGDLPGKQEVRIVVAEFADPECYAVTPGMQTLEAVDTAVDNLIEALNAMRERAKLSLLDTNARIRAEDA